MVHGSECDGAEVEWDTACYMGVNVAFSEQVTGPRHARRVAHW